MTLARRTPIVPVLAIFALLSACSLLTVERIVEQRDTTAEAPLLASTVDALHAQIDQQNDRLEDLATYVAAIATENGALKNQITYLATRGPASGPAAAGPPSTTPTIVQGGVEIEDGFCCVGGPAGNEIDISVRFTAYSQKAPVTEMRYRTGGFVELEQDIELAPWVPYTEELVFTYLVPINWSGFYIRVQYRDFTGNLSPIYTDDISVEGEPPLTPSPGG